MKAPPRPELVTALAAAIRVNRRKPPRQLALKILATIKATGLVITDRNVSGERNPKAKLSRQQVNRIRVSKKRSILLAAHYRVHKATIQRIRSGTQWSEA